MENHDSSNKMTKFDEDIFLQIDFYNRGRKLTRIVFPGLAQTVNNTF